MLFARLRETSPLQANRANALLTAGCPKQTVKDILACADGSAREARLAEEEQRYDCGPLADSPLLY